MREEYRQNGLNGCQSRFGVFAERVSHGQLKRRTVQVQDVPIFETNEQTCCLFEEGLDVAS